MLVRRTLTVLVAVLLAFTVVPGYAVTGTPGATTAGDSLFPGFGNGGYDATHYDISLRYFEDGHIAAATIMTATATQNLSSLSLDLEGLRVAAVTVNGRAAAYRQSGHKLIVTPRSVVPAGQVIRVRVLYSGTPRPYIDPDGSRDGWMPTKNGVAVLAEPVGAMTWFPDDDTPRDKATYDVHVTARRHRVVAGVGVLTSRVVRPYLATTTWHQAQPISSYLQAIAIGPFTAVTGSADGVPLTSYLDYGSNDWWAPRTTAAALRFFAATFGAYPFATGGVTVIAGLPFSLEVATRPSLDAGSVTEGILVHEFSHQWYGDEVTPADWGDIWLNEGFATYATWLWWGRTRPNYPQQQLNRLYATEPASFWSLPPAALGSARNLFARPVYLRGAMLLQDLHNRIGQRAFSTLMRRWLTTHRYRAVRTGQFIRLAHRVSGQRLWGFFHRWLYRSGRPAL